ncbi:MAG: adenylate/guanylate cyclase domain-containing protein [bacterium]
MKKSMVKGMGEWVSKKVVGGLKNWRDIRVLRALSFAFAGLFLVGSIICGVFAYFNYAKIRNERQSLIERMGVDAVRDFSSESRELLSLVATGGSPLEQDLASVHVNERIQEIKRGSVGVESIFLVDSNMKIVAHDDLSFKGSVYEPGEVGALGEREILKREYAIGGMGLIHIAVPVRDDSGAKLGEAHLALSQTAVDDALGREFKGLFTTVRVLISAGSVLLIFALLLSIIVPFLTRLWVQLSLIVALLVIVIAVAMGAVLLAQAERALDHQLRLRGTVIAYTLQAGVADDLLVGERDRMAIAINRAKRISEGVEYVAVVGANGEIAGHSERGLVGRVYQEPEGLEPLGEKEILAQSYSIAGREIYDIAVPVIVGEKRIGQVHVGMAKYAIREAIDRSRRSAVWILISSLAAGVGLALVIGIFTTRPIHVIARGAERVAEGDLSFNAKVIRYDEVGQLSQSFNNMVQGLREKEYIKDTFGRYVTKEVAEAVLKGGITLGGERREVTVLFSDIRNFTPFTESHEAEEVVGMLNEYFTAMVDIILENRGTLDKFIGDAVMAVFGAPISQEDHAERAVLTALQMREALEKFNARRISQGKEGIRIGIGINTGEVIAGNVGSEKRMEYTVVGDNVNIASRVEGLTKQYEADILITDNTYKKVKDLVRVKRHAPVVVKGKANPIRIYEVISAK